MEFRNHLGILLLLIISFLFSWLVTTESRKRFKWYIPIASAFVLFIIFEIVNWIIVLCFF